MLFSGIMYISKLVYIFLNLIFPLSLQVFHCLHEAERGGEEALHPASVQDSEEEDSQEMMTV